jgi:hypothetical protein
MNTLIVWVRGAGVDGVNGMYECDRLYNNRPLFVHHDEVLGETYYMHRTHNGWMIVSSTSFRCKTDVPFYHCRSTEPVDLFIPPPSQAWECCARKTEGMRALLAPPPTSVTYAWMAPALLSMTKLASWILEEEEREDAVRADKEAKRDQTEKGRNGVCPSWTMAGACTKRQSGCDKTHPLQTRLQTGRPICVNYVSSPNSCDRGSYGCNFSHPVRARHNNVLSILKEE